MLFLAFKLPQKYLYTSFTFLYYGLHQREHLSMVWVIVMLGVTLLSVKIAQTSLERAGILTLALCS
jgi:hypothetical protein